MKFNEISFNKEVTDSINRVGYIEMTPIQSESIPVILAGNDVIGQAQTGTGKTAAFLLPTINKIDRLSHGIQCLILAPTRELVAQIDDEARKLSYFSKLKVGTIIGGVDYRRQYTMIASKPHILVATPGRLLDHLNSGKLKLNQINTFIIDEADEMLKVGFKEDIDKIAAYLPKGKQTLLFSATMNKDVKKIADKTMFDPKEILVSSGLATTKNIEQFAILLKEKDKLKVLTRLLDLKKDEQSLVFGRTKKRADELAQALGELGYSSRALHGDLQQRQRLQIIKEFKAGNFDTLIATDVAARGLDIPNVTNVYNFDLPQEVEYYVHRIGRCGRAHNLGVATSLLRDSELPHLDRIKKDTKSTITFLPIPSFNDVQTSNEEVAVSTLVESLEDVNSIKFMTVAKKLLSKYDAEELVAACINKLIIQSPSKLPTLTGEPPVRIKGSSKGKGSYKGKRTGNYSRRDNSKGGKPGGSSKKKYYDKNSGPKKKQSYSKNKKIG